MPLPEADARRFVLQQLARHNAARRGTAAKLLDAYSAESSAGISVKSAGGCAPAPSAARHRPGELRARRADLNV